MKTTNGLQLGFLGLDKSRLLGMFQTLVIQKLSGILVMMAGPFHLSFGKKREDIC